MASFSILDSVVPSGSSSKPAQKNQTNSVPSILESFGSPQKQRQVRQTSEIGSELSRLELLQASLANQMDLFPVKQDKNGQTQSGSSHRQQHQAQQKERVSKLIDQAPQMSILMTDLFQNREDQRERMMKMYTNEELQRELSSRDHQVIDDQVSDAASSINDRLMDTTTNQEPPIKQLKMKGKKQSELTEVDFDLSKTGAKLKNVSFAANTKEKRSSSRQKSQEQLTDFSQRQVNEGVTDVMDQLDVLRNRTLEVQSGVSDGFSVEDSKLLEAVMEHILIHWDDIMACLVDELIEEEVLELNRIDEIRKGGDPEAKAREELIDMLFEKKKHYTLVAPELGIKCTREL